MCSRNFCEGEEISFLVVSDGERIAPLVAAQDHKRVGDGDTGPNTGGMGAYSVLGNSRRHHARLAGSHIARPVIDGMRDEGMTYTGVLYCGLMMTARGPMVLEFNCRFGDPETQPILMRLDSDLRDAFMASIEGRVSDGDFKWSPDALRLRRDGLGRLSRAAYEVGKLIDAELRQADSVPGVKVFHAGTTFQDGRFYTAGGRVLGVTARGGNLAAAVDRAYEAVAKINFEGMHYRQRHRTPRPANALENLGLRPRSARPKPVRRGLRAKQKPRNLRPAVHITSAKFILCGLPIEVFQHFDGAPQLLVCLRLLGSLSRLVLLFVVGRDKLVSGVCHQNVRRDRDILNRLAVGPEILGHGKQQRRAVFQLQNLLN